jgi:hypothetical protein
MLERFSKFVGMFQIWLRSSKKRALNFTTYTHFWLHFYPNSYQVHICRSESCTMDQKLWENLQHTFHVKHMFP